MSTTRFVIAVEVDTTAMIHSASIVLGQAALPHRDVLEERVADSIKRAVKDNVPHVVSVGDFDMKDC
jgi:uncharacterized membrane protein (UPF0182 family)